MSAAETSRKPPGGNRTTERKQSGQERALGAKAVYGVLERESFTI